MAKLPNDYQRAFGALYAKTPKAVFAAVAYGLFFNNGDESRDAVAAFVNEWRILHENGIVPQRPPKELENARA